MNFKLELNWHSYYAFHLSIALNKNSIFWVWYFEFDLSNSVLQIWYENLMFWIQCENLKYQIQNIKFKVSNSKYQIQNIKFKISKKGGNRCAPSRGGKKARHFSGDRYFIVLLQRQNVCIPFFVLSYRKLTSKGGNLCEGRFVVTLHYKWYWMWLQHYQRNSSIMLLKVCDSYFQSNPFTNLPQKRIMQIQH